MILSLTLVAFALAVLLLLLYLESGHNAPVLGVDELAGHTRPVDIEAFRNLMDPGEDEFLRANLRPQDFRAIQKARTRSALDYIRKATHNAAYLTRVGEAAARSADPRVAQAGNELVDRALRLRAYSLLAIAQMYIRLALPTVQFSYSKLVDNYQHLSHLAGQVALMEQPAHAAKLSAPL
jgi:hypothetical protein